jgi:intracellular sulfur oxidation DsrE/DsrF family protein
MRATEDGIDKAKARYFDAKRFARRRSILWAAASAFGAAFAASRAGAATERPGNQKLKVVYHLSDHDKAGFVVGNIQNHLDGVGGPDNVTIVLVVHGQALRAFHASSANPDLTKHIGQFSRYGIELAACGNTMKAQKIGLTDLLPGFIAVDQGGVVRIAELQLQGYLYLRP